MKLAEVAAVTENTKSFEPYFVMDISHEPDDKIQVHVLNSSNESDDYHIQVLVNEKTWEIESISGWNKESNADVEKDKEKIVDAVNDQFKKFPDLKPVKTTEATKIND